MKKVLAIAICSFLLGFISCNSGDKKDDPDSVIDEKSNVVNNEEAAAVDKNSKWEQRKAKGDTMAIPYKDLQAFLPEIAGYSKDGGPKGSQMDIPGMGSLSETEQAYVNGDKRISIKIVDYNAAWQTFQGMTAIYGMGFSTEDDTKKQSHSDLGLKNVYAYQTSYKTEPKSELIIIANDRFMISLNSDGENSESFLKDVAKQMNLGKLGAL